MKFENKKKCIVCKKEIEYHTDMPIKDKDVICQKCQKEN